MTDKQLEAKLRELLQAAESANREFDHLVYETEQIPPSDFRDVLSTELMFLRDELGLLVRDSIWPGLAAA